MSSEISEVVSGQVNERFLEVPTNSTYFADLATLNAAQSGAQNPFDAVVREVVDLRAADGDMSAFDSRYVPQANDKFFLGAGSMENVTGAAASNASGIYFCWALGANDDDYAGGNVYVPAWWNTYHIDVVWSIDANESGDVRFVLYRDNANNGENILTGQTSDTLTATASAKDIVTHSRIVTSSTLAVGGLLVATLRRDGANGVDTLNADCKLLGLLFTRAS